MSEIKLVNGKFRPRCKKSEFIYNLFLDVCLITATILLINEILNWPNFNLWILIGTIIIIPILDYFMLISPYQQYIEKYRIEFVDENTLDGFKLYYKNKQVEISYKIDENGKFIFEKNRKKVECIFYKDGSKMSYLTKRRILSYFEKWLENNNFLPKEI